MNSPVRAVAPIADKNADGSKSLLTGVAIGAAVVGVTAAIINAQDD